MRELGKDNLIPAKEFAVINSKAEYDELKLYIERLEGVKTFLLTIVKESIVKHGSDQ